MKLYVTSIEAICPTDGSLKSWGGPHVPGISFADAELYCQRNGLGYCKVEGILLSEIPCKDGSYEPDFTKEVLYGKVNLN